MTVKICQLEERVQWDFVSDGYREWGGSVRGLYALLSVAHHDTSCLRKSLKHCWPLGN